MGTVEKILDTLNKKNEDSKNQASVYYSEHSLWLKNSFLELKEKIHPSLSSAALRQAVAAAVETDEDQEQRMQPPLPLPTYVKDENTNNENRQKRKSPEANLKSTFCSPLPKRTSTDFNEITAAAGLPSDLGKLKKEELLHELESRGNTTMTMRAKKQDLIDVLKALLIDLHARKNLPMEPEPLFQSSSQSALTTPLPTSASSVAAVSSVERKPSYGSGSPARKMSVLAEARNHVNGVRASLLIEKSETDDQRQQRLAKEYEARRNRSSQVRLSHATGAGADGRGRTASVESNVSEKEEMVHPPQDVVSSEDIQIDDMPQDNEEEQPRNEEDHVDHAEGEQEDEEDEENPDDHNDNWNEVPSPSAAAAAAKELKKQQEAEAETQQEEEEEEEAEEDEEPPRPTPPSSSPFKQLSNLVGGTQLSFLTGGSSHQSSKPKEKAVVPALQQAQRLKEKEEAKAAQKKKEMEDKKKEHMKKIQATSASNSVNVSSSKLFQTSAKVNKTTASAAAPVVAPVATATPVAAAPVQKKGFGWWRRDKDAIATPTTAAAATAATAAAPVTAPALASKGGKDKIFTSSHTASASGTAARKEPVVVDLQDDDDDDQQEDQENVKPFASTATPASPAPIHSSTTPVASVPLKENKSIPTTATVAATAAAPSTPSHHPTASSASSTPHSTNSYEPSPQPAPHSTLHSSTSTSTATPTGAKVAVSTVSAAAVSNSPPQPQYQIDDRDDSGSDTGDEDENDQQSVPDWAKQPKLRQALERQYGLIPGVPAVDPDTLFPDVQTCVLEEIFGRKEGKGGKYAVRTSSAKWDADVITLVEKRKYRHQMGYNVGL